MAYPKGGTSIQKADLGKRIIAAIIDGLIAGIPYAVLGVIPVIGGLVGAVIAGGYMLTRDGLEVDFMRQRSLGKKIMKLRAVRLDGQPMDLQTSIKRNAPLAIGYVGGLFAIIPVLGWVIMAVAGFAQLLLSLAEIYFVVTDQSGRRYGDKMAGTQVIEVQD